LVFVVGVFSLVNHAKAVGLLYEGTLVCVTEEPVEAEKSEHWVILVGLVGEK
jgi:hypothetical protein